MSCPESRQPHTCHTCSYREWFVYINCHSVARWKWQSTYDKKNNVQLRRWTKFFIANFRLLSPRRQCIFHKIDIAHLHRTLRVVFVLIIVLLLLILLLLRRLLAMCRFFQSVCVRRADHTTFRQQPIMNLLCFHCHRWFWWFVWLLLYETKTKNNRHISIGFKISQIHYVQLQYRTPLLPFRKFEVKFHLISEVFKLAESIQSNSFMENHFKFPRNSIKNNFFHQIFGVQISGVGDGTPYSNCQMTIH